MRNRLTSWLLLAIALVAVPFWWLLIDTDPGNARPKPVHIADLRVLAATIPGPHPAALTYTLLATRLSWGDVFTAGIGLKRRPLAIIAWSLPVPGKGPIVIDPGPLPAEASMGEFKNFDRVRQNRIDAETRIAGHILFTQGPMSGSPPAILPLGKAGLSSTASVPAPASAIRPSPLPTAQAVAPGVVVIPAPGHAPGAQLIFVQLADGREFLFTGNIATLTENWTQLRARSHLAAEWGPAQDRAETYAWLRTIRQLGAEAPKMKIVPGHDYDWLTGQRSAGTISEFQPPLPSPRGSTARRNLR